MARIFMIGTKRITEDPSMKDLPNDQIQNILRTQYPEVANATIRERTEGEDKVIEFLPRAGHKG